MPRKSAASPLAIFLDYILTTDLASGTAALEASIAALGARQRVTRTRDVAVAQEITNKLAPGLMTPPTSGPFAVPAAAPIARRGRKPGSKNLSTSERMAANAPARRRRRPSVEEDVPLPGINPLPDQTVPDQNEEV